MKTNIIHVSFGSPDTQLGARTHVSLQQIECSIVTFDCRVAPRKSLAEYSVALVAGGAVLGFDHQVHIDLDRAHTVLSPDDARQFATELKRIADVIDPLLESG
jgi:hypothetical protein